MITPSHLIELASALIAIPSTTGHEQTIADWMTAHFRRLNLPHIHRLPVTEAADTIIAWTDPLPGAPADAPTLMFNFHIDTFSPSSGWTHDPFTPRLEGNRLYGMGSHDMKGGAASALAALESLLATPAGRQGRLVVAATTDEENWSRGAHAVINQVLKAGLLDRIDYCLIPEPTLPGTVRIGARGRHVFHLRFQGVRANVAYQDGGINAIADAARIASYLCNNKGEHHEIDLGYSAQFDMRGTLEVVGIHSGGTDILMPEAADVYIDHHIMPGYRVEQTAAHLRALIDRVGVTGSYTLTWDERPTPAPPAFITPPESRFVQSVQRHLAQAMGHDIRLTLGRSVCDANHFAGFGDIATIVCGPQGGNTCEAHEFVTVDSMVAVAQTYQAVARELLGGK